MATSKPSKFGLIHTHNLFGRVMTPSGFRRVENYFTEAKHACFAAYLSVQPFVPQSEQETVGWAALLPDPAQSSPRKSGTGFEFPCFFFPFWNTTLFISSLSASLFAEKELKSSSIFQLVSDTHSELSAINSAHCRCEVWFVISIRDISYLHSLIY